MLSTIVSHRYEYSKKKENEQGLILYVYASKKNAYCRENFCIKTKHMFL